jgi:hypothetical protein
MTCHYYPSSKHKDDPPISVALFSPPNLTLLDYNFPRFGLRDVKGFEIILLLFSSIFLDLIRAPTTLSSYQVKKETARLEKLEKKAEEKTERRKRKEEKESMKYFKMQGKRIEDREKGEKSNRESDGFPKDFEGGPDHEKQGPWWRKGGAVH